MSRQPKASVKLKSEPAPKPLPNPVDAPAVIDLSPYFPEPHLGGAIQAALTRQGNALPFTPAKGHLDAIGANMGDVVAGIGKFGVKAEGPPEIEGREPTLYDLEADAIPLTIEKVDAADAVAEFAKGAVVMVGDAHFVCRYRTVDGLRFVTLKGLDGEHELSESDLTDVTVVRVSRP